MNKADKQLFTELVKEDNIGMVLRGHLHVERSLINFLSSQLLYPDRIDWGKIDYTGKVELSLSCGLNVDIRPALEQLGVLRNKFANSFDAQVEPDWVLNAYFQLPKQIKDKVEAAYKDLDHDIEDDQSTLDTRNLLILVFICVANAIESLTKKTPIKKAMVKRKAKK